MMRNQRSESLGFSAGRYRYLEGELLRKYQLCLLDITSDVLELCEEEGIACRLGGGTALGAVRNGGFIPWDDDVDINMSGDDYEHFRDCFLRKHGDKYFIQDANTTGYSKPMIRVCLKGSVYRDSNTGSADGCIFIEIFRMENVYDNFILRYLHGFLCMAAGFLYCCRRYYVNQSEYIRAAKETSGNLRKVVFRASIGFMTCILSLDRLRKIVWKCYGLCKNSESKYVAFPSGRKHYFGEIHPRKLFNETIRIPFEGHQWLIPKDYDAYFRKLYGPNYMTPPPEEKREHHFLYELNFPDEK